MQNTHSESDEGMFVDDRGELVFVLLSEGNEGIYPITGIQEIEDVICLKLRG